VGNRTPVSLITGFLGSGKTTLLSRLIHHRGMADTAVIINEFGEIGLDHQLVEPLEGEAVLLASGCVCCTLRDDLSRTLLDMAERRAAGGLPPFRRMVIETTGLADPAPILHALMRDVRMREIYALDGVITTVDAVHGARQLERQPESVKQAAVADRLVLTKSDLAQEPGLTELEGLLRRVNPGAPVLRAVSGEIDPEALFGVGVVPEQQAWGDAHDHVCGPDCGHDHGHHHKHGHDHDHHGHHAHEHLDGIVTHAFRFEQPLDWAVVAEWLGSLTYFHGDALLRMKGLLNVQGEPVPVAVHAVHHLFHEPVELSAWPDEDRSSRLVFITRGLERDVIAAAYAAAAGAAQA
jgi:G3E family GTPase